MQDSIEWGSQNSCVKSLGINFYLFLPTHLSTILLRKHGLMSKSTSKRYYRVVILFSRLFCLVLVSIDYKIPTSITIPSDAMVPYADKLSSRNFLENCNRANSKSSKALHSIISLKLGFRLIYFKNDLCSLLISIGLQ